ncbi:MAG TPA: outer membrane beta-barrel protein [Vicinamibacterales bacterium]|nr:outer membrane beta-barrel protein [Vicinamibacterales bacterium]
MPSCRATLLLAVILLSGAAPAAAQGWSERLFFSINGAFQTATNDFSDRFEFERDLETGSTESDYRVQSGFLFDGGGGYRLWKNLGVGVAVSVFTREDSAATRSSFPHPFFFEQPREVTGDATGVTRRETAAHVYAAYLWRVSEPLRIVLSAGPSFFNVEQDVVTEVTITETYPYDTAAFASARKERQSGSAPAFNVGADVMWMLTRNVGVGGVVRFSQASIDLDAPRGRTISVDAGGPYVGGGVRFLF